MTFTSPYGYSCIKAAINFEKLLLETEPWKKQVSAWFYIVYFKIGLYLSLLICDAIWSDGKKLKLNNFFVFLQSNSGFRLSCVE